MRSTAQQRQAKEFATVGFTRRRGKLSPVVVDRQTLEQWLEAGGRITQCEPVTGDPAAAIQRVRKVRAELKFPKSPKNTRSTT